MIGLILYRKIEEALDRGIAVIVPMPSGDSIPSKWKFLSHDRVAESAGGCVNGRMENDYMGNKFYIANIVSE